MLDQRKDSRDASSTSLTAYPRPAAPPIVFDATTGNGLARMRAAQRMPASVAAALARLFVEESGGSTSPAVTGRRCA
jgi:hypothetical protein